LTVLAQAQPAGIIPFDQPIGGACDEFGNRSLISAGNPVRRPSAFALTGSKSTNHDLKSAFAIASKVSLVLRLSSIFSSRVPEDVGACFLLYYGKY
jgi:hypothetical protein